MDYEPALCVSGRYQSGKFCGYVRHEQKKMSSFLLSLIFCMGMKFFCIEMIFPFRIVSGDRLLLWRRFANTAE